MENPSPDDIPQLRKRQRRQLPDPTKIDRLPPHSLESEQGLLGCILLAPEDCFDEICEKTKHRGVLFYDERHRTIFEAMLRMWQDREPIGLPSVFITLKAMNVLDAIGGMGYLSTLQDTTPSAANLGYFLQKLIECHKARFIIGNCTDATRDLYEGKESSEVHVRLESSLIDFDMPAFGVFGAKSLATVTNEEIERRCEFKGKLTGVPSGIDEFDNLTGGIQYGELTIAGARPSVGKSAWLQLVMRTAAFIHKIPTVFVTLEMSAPMMMMREASAGTNIRLKAIRNGWLDAADMGVLGAYQADVVIKSPLTVIDGSRGMNTDQLKAIARRYSREGVRLFIVDYLQKLRAVGRNEKRYREVAECSACMFEIARVHNMAMVSAAQLNRGFEKRSHNPDENSEPPKPKLSDLREAGDIEQDADLIALLDRPRTKDNPQGTKATLTIAKQRNGELGTVDMDYNPDFCRFENPKTENQGE